MDAYKERRYGGWFGWARWAKDKLLGMPSEVNSFYTSGRQLFLNKMDAVIDNVVAIIGAGLAEAKAEIANGKKRIQEYLAGLPDNLQEVGKQAALEIQGKFDSLESSVDSKQNELIDTLAKKYNEKLSAVDARIEELKAANQGLVQKALNAVVGAIKIILKLKDMLLNVLSRVASAIGKIIKHPIQFLGNLIKGVTQGFKNFGGRIKEHLISGLVGWLTGALGPLGITLPDDIFSLEGIFSLVVQILGLTWENIRAKAVKLLGEPAVQLLEKSFDVFKILISEGPAGLWEFLKEEFSDLKDTVVGAIEDMIETEVVQAGIEWIMGLLTPAGAFIKAAKAIYKIVMFFVEKGSQVMELVNSVIDGIGAIASGAISGAASLIENALARALPLVIGFLASLLGLDDLAEKVQKIIKSIRARIDKAIDGLILKAKQFTGKGTPMAAAAPAGVAGQAVTAGTGDAAGPADQAGPGQAGSTKEPETPISTAVKEMVKKDLDGKSISDAKQAKSMISTAYKKYKPQGLKSIKLVPDPDKPDTYDVIVAASEPEVVARVKTGDTAELIKLAKNFIPYTKRTSLYVFYDADKKPFPKSGAPLSNSKKGHAETRFKNSLLPKLLKQIEKERSSLKTPPGEPVPVFIEMNRLPCDGCAPMMASLASENAQTIKLTLQASSVSKADWQSIQKTSIKSLIAMHKAGIHLDVLQIWSVLRSKLKAAGVEEIQLGREYFVNLNQWTGDYESKEAEVQELLSDVLREVNQVPGAKIP